MIPVTPTAGVIRPHPAPARAATDASMRLGRRSKRSAEWAASSLVRGPSAAAAGATGQSTRHGKRGLLVKKGHLLRTQKERLFVLQGPALRYYRVRAKPKSADAVELKGALQLEATDVVTPMKGSDQWFRVRKLVGPDGKGYKLDLKGWFAPRIWLDKQDDAYRELYAAAADANERQEWIDAIRAACRVRHKRSDAIFGRVDM